MSYKQLQNNRIKPRAFNSYIDNHDGAPKVLNLAGGAGSYVFSDSLIVAGFERFTLVLEITAYAGTPCDLMITQINTVGSAVDEVLSPINALGIYKFDFGGGSGVLAYRVFSSLNFYVTNGVGTLDLRCAELFMLG